MLTPLTDDDIETLVREFVGDDVRVIFSTRDAYIDQALSHPFIRVQISMGIYPLDTFAEDFLGPARSHSDSNELYLCTAIFNQVLDNIPDDIARDYVRYVGAHEAHHFHKNHVPSGWQEHALSEQECNDDTERAHPELSGARDYVEANSAPHLRLLARLRMIHLNNGDNRAKGLPR